MNKDSKLLAEAYENIRSEKPKMTSQQEHVYSKYRSFDWEFDRWEDGNVIMTKWDRGLDSAARLAELIIKPDGEHYRLKD